MSLEHKTKNPFSLNATYSIKLSESDIEYLKEEALKRGWTVSKLIRYALYAEGLTVSCK